ncbi:unnamed protein product [Sphenostylis stenocarpa]|uniref:Uncharacterized protein n=1 Tax=Sphenostylis stenocarpa TaxID=92480 RepID=A0AA86RLQ0_9FABA|nr:unnamed protein product [Sphenostylis stenocarpa]
MAINSSCSKAILGTHVPMYAPNASNTPKFSLTPNGHKGCSSGFPKLVQNKGLFPLHAVPSKTMELDEDTHWFINTEEKKEKIRKIIQYQKSLYRSTTSSSFSSSAASSSSFSSPHKSSSLLKLMKGGSTSMRRLFDMEHTSLATHFDFYSGSPITKPISLWESDSEHDFQDPWALIKEVGPTRFVGTDRESELASKGCYVDGDFGSQNRNLKSSKRKLTRKKSFRRLPGFGLWRCGRFRFPLRFRRLKLRDLHQVFNEKSNKARCGEKLIAWPATQNTNQSPDTCK